MQDLKNKATQIRRDSLRMIAHAGSGHPGGSLSAADIIAALYFKIMRHRPEDPGWEDRDRFVLSKGHACPALYSALARSGYFHIDELKTLRSVNSRLQGHPSKKDLPGIEATTGSLGQGISIALGMAIAGKIDRKNYRVFCMLGDGELQEGQVWEAAIAAPNFQLSNLCVIVDRNRVQLTGPTQEIMKISPVFEKWEAFGWHVEEIDGHDMEQIVGALGMTTQKPLAIIARTIKGKGVSFMENKAEWHGKAPSKEQLKKALEEI